MNQLSQKSDPGGPWETEAFSLLEQLDASWAGACRAMSTNPWSGTVLPRKFADLVAIAINVACTNLNAEGARRHIRNALVAGATGEEILTIIKMASVMSIHSCSLGAPILLEEAAICGRSPAPKPVVATPACDKMKAMRQWNDAWNPFFELDPQWTDQFMTTGAGIYGSAVFDPRETELLSIAFDASFTHMYAPGTRRHIKGALMHGASVEEIMEVLKLCVVQGVEASNLAVPILVEELAERKSSGQRGSDGTP